MDFNMSVVILSYHPVKEKLMATLRSVVMQRAESFEIIIADDGSPDFFREEICAYLEEQGFQNYQILAHDQNVGTVINLMDAVKIARGKYVKPISPGDYLYDESVLDRVMSFMEENNARIAYGDMVYYFDEKGLKIIDRKTPVDDQLYESGYKRYSAKTAQKHQMIYNDGISGAATFYERALFLECLQWISSHVKYAEDVICQLVAVRGERIFRIPGFCVWYEYGSGISTNGTMGYSERLARDFCGFYQKLHNEYPRDFMITRACFTWKWMLGGNRIANFLRQCVEVDKHFFRIRRKKLLKKWCPDNPDRKKYHMICRERT